MFISEKSAHPVKADSGTIEEGTKEREKKCPMHTRFQFDEGPKRRHPFSKGDCLGREREDWQYAGGYRIWNIRYGFDKRRLQSSGVGFHDQRSWFSQTELTFTDEVNKDCKAHSSW